MVVLSTHTGGLGVPVKLADLRCLRCAGTISSVGEWTASTRLFGDGGKVVEQAFDPTQAFICRRPERL